MIANRPLKTTRRYPPDSAACSQPPHGSAAGPTPVSEQSTPCSPAGQARSNTNDSTALAAVRLYTPAEAAILLAVRESWLRRKAGQRRIPCTFVGRHLRFSAADLAGIVENGATPAMRHSAPRRPR